MREERPQDARLQVLLGELLSGLALLRMNGQLGWDEERWQELCTLLRWDGRPNPPDITARLREWRTYSPATIPEAAHQDPLWYAVKLLAGGAPDDPNDNDGMAPFAAIGWDAERKVLSFRRHYEEWMNLWLEAPNRDGEPYAERNGGPAADTVVLWGDDR